VVDSATGLIAVGVRSVRARAEVTKALSPARMRDERLHGAGRLVERLATTTLADDAPQRAAVQQVGGQCHLQATRGLSSGSPLRFERAEDVPIDLATAHLVRHVGDYGTDMRNLDAIFASLPCVARSRAQDLYLPREVADLIARPWKPEQTIAMLQTWRRTFLDVRKAAAARPEGPTRKGPCPCGSGKKHKRCCGS
jgi:hypothetical protein